MRISDWSSDVCSSDLPDGENAARHIKRNPVQRVALPFPTSRIALASGDDHAEWHLHPDCVEMGDAILLLGRQGRNTSKYDQQRYAAPYASQTHSHSLMKASRSEEQTSELQSLMHISY